jgi:hypothetical protein
MVPEGSDHLAAQLAFGMWLLVLVAASDFRLLMSRQPTLMRC